MHTVPYYGYGRTINGQVTGTVHPSTVRPVMSAKGQRLRDGYVYGCSTVDGWYSLCIEFDIADVRLIVRSVTVFNTSPVSPPASPQLLYGLRFLIPFTISHHITLLLRYAGTTTCLSTTSHPPHLAHSPLRRGYQRSWQTMKRRSSFMSPMMHSSSPLSRTPTAIPSHSLKCSNAKTDHFGRRP